MRYCAAAAAAVALPFLEDGFHFGEANIDMRRWVDLGVIL